MRISDWSSDVCSSDLSWQVPLPSVEEKGLAGAGSGFAAVERLDQKGMEDGPGDVGVADLAIAGGDIGHLLARFRDGGADRHEGRHHVRPDGIEIGRASCMERVCQDV